MTPREEFDDDLKCLMINVCRDSGGAFFMEPDTKIEKSQFIEKWGPKDE